MVGLDPNPVPEIETLTVLSIKPSEGLMLAISGKPIRDMPAAAMLSLLAVLLIFNSTEPVALKFLYSVVLYAWLRILTHSVVPFLTLPLYVIPPPTTTSLGNEVVHVTLENCVPADPPLVARCRRLRLRLGAGASRKEQR
jgi:hypothetical protein